MNAKGGCDANGRALGRHLGDRAGPGGRHRPRQPHLADDARVSLSRDTLRLCLSNAHGGRNLVIGAARLALRAHTRGIKLFAATLTPFENETFLPGAWTPEHERTRRDLNRWVCESGDSDAVVDFDWVLRDPEHPTRMPPVYDCGDHLHPSDRGYLQMGESISLSLFD